MKFDNVIFDMDGVLIDNSEGIFDCVKKAAEKLNLGECTEEVLRSFVGPALKYSFKKNFNLSDEMCWKAIEEYEKYFLDDGIYKYRVYEGTEEVLKTLNDAGIKCTLCSGKLLSSADKVLRSSGLDKYFSRVSAFDVPPSDSDKTELLKKAIAGSNPLMAGDRIFDIDCARNAGIKVCYALYGFGSREETEKGKPDFVINDIRELLNIVI